MITPSDIPAHRLAWAEVQGGTGEPMLLLHGMLSSRRQWEPNLERLKAVVRPVVVDWWGHGESPCPLEPEPYRMAALMRQLDAIRQVLAVERIWLCGQSFGAGPALRYTIEWPHRVLGVVFTNSVSALSAPEAFGSAAERAARAATLEAGGRSAIQAMPFHPRHARRIEEPFRTRLIEAADAVDARAVARLSTVTGPELSVQADLDRLSRPVLLTNGRWEKAFQPLRDDVARRLATCRIADLEGGHAVNIDAPGAFDEAVVQFVGQVAQAADAQVVRSG